MQTGNKCERVKIHALPSRRPKAVDVKVLKIKYSTPSFARYTSHMTDRRSARNQPLPPEEKRYLRSLPQEDLIKRVHDLYHEGWTLQAIGDSLTPPRPRSTVRSWLLRFTPPTERDLVDAPIQPVPTPSPDYKTHPEGYQKTTPPSPGILPDEAELIQSIAPIARQYRAKMSTSSAAAVANDQLTAICLRLHANGVPVKDLAKAAGVTYRAMYRRIKLTK